jgi:hypothetical protein
MMTPASALLNAPFDWASLGLTRALLRRGLELGGWWPRRQPRARAGGLVSTVRRLSSLPESAPAFGGICAAR